MAISRRTLMSSLGASVLGVGALSGCGEGRLRGGRGGRRKETTPPPTADPLAEPDQALVLGSIGASHGRTSAFEKQISIAVEEAMIDINARWEGLFGHDVRMVPRHVMAEPGEDIAEAVAALAEQGVTAVISSLDEDALLAALPHFVEADIAVIDVITSGMILREAEVDAANMLIRLAPNNDVIATMIVEESKSGGNSQRAGTSGHIVYVSEDTTQGRDLKDRIAYFGNPEDAPVVAERFYPVGAIDRIDELVDEVVGKHPALLVVNGGPEVGPFLSALHEATLDEGNRPTIEIPVRLSPAATRDYTKDELAPECLSRATGWEPGGALTDDHVNMMLNRDPGLLEIGYAYSQQAYDAVVLACLAAQNALSTTGSAIAGNVQRVLTGDTECTDYGMCRLTLRDAIDAGTRATITYKGRTGDLVLDGDSDAQKGAMRTYTFGPAGALITGNATTFDSTT